MEINPTSTSTSEVAQPSESAPRGKGVYTFMVWLGALLALVAWVVLFWNGRTSFYIAIAALVASCIGVKSHRKNLAVTAIVASSVLMLVFAVFEGAIYFLLRSV